MKREDLELDQRAASYFEVFKQFGADPEKLCRLM